MGMGAKLFLAFEEGHAGKRNTLLLVLRVYIEIQRAAPAAFTCTSDVFFQTDIMPGKTILPSVFSIRWEEFTLLFNFPQLMYK